MDSCFATHMKWKETDIANPIFRKRRVLNVLLLCASLRALLPPLLLMLRDMLLVMLLDDRGAEPGEAGLSFSRAGEAAMISSA